MADVSYVLPDTFPGEPAEREAFACRSGCDLVEVAVGDAPPPALPWLLRAASIDEDDRDRPRWHDRPGPPRSWRQRPVTGDRPPAAVVIEPGDEWIPAGRPGPGDRRVRAGLLTRFGTASPVLVANRAEQSLPDGAALAGFWDHLNRHAQDLAPHVGIALDAPEFYAATRTRMTAESALLPPTRFGTLRAGSTRGGGKPDSSASPSPGGPGLVRRAPGTVLIAPAVRDPAALEPAILFCMVSLQGRAFTLEPAALIRVHFHGRRLCRAAMGSASAQETPVVRT